MAETVNGAGQHVFGNTDMKVCLPEEKYQHFYEGLPSTNGLSGKWINELRIYPNGAPAVIQETESGSPAGTDAPGSDLNWLPLMAGAAGLAIITASGGYLLIRRRKEKYRR